MKTLKRNILLSIISIGVILITAAAFLITSAFYQGRKTGEGSIIFDKGIQIEIDNGAVDSLSKDMDLTLQYYPNKDTSQSKLDFSVAPTGKTEYYIANPSIITTGTSEPFYLRLKLECEYYVNGSSTPSTFAMSESDQEVLFNLFFTDAHYSPVLFNDYFAADAKGEYYYYVSGGYGVATKDNLAQVGPNSEISFFKGTIVNGVTPITTVDFKPFGDSVPGNITKISLSLKMQITNSKDAWANDADLPDVELLDKNDITVSNGQITAINTNATTYGLPGYIYDDNGNIVSTITSIASGVNSIDSNAVKVFFPSTLTTVGGYCNTPSLTNVYLGNNVQTIASNAFTNAKLSKHLILPKSLTTIGESAYQNCSTLTGKLTFPYGVNSIGASAFAGCAGFSGELLLPNGVTQINPHTFEGCAGFTGALNLQNVSTIGDNAFASCSGFNGTLNLSTNLTSIGSNAFAGCVNLQGPLTIPSNVSTIGGAAFAGCSNFTTVIIDSTTVAALDSSSSNLLSYADEVYVLGTSTTVGNYITDSFVETVSDKSGYRRFGRGYLITWDGGSTAGTLDASLWNFAGVNGYSATNTGDYSKYSAFSGETATSMVGYGGKNLYCLPIPLIAGHTFDGWYSASTGGVKVANADGTWANNATGFTGSDGSWIKNSATTLYARYTKKVYTISYNYNNGIAGATAPTNYSVGAGTIISNPTRTGYTFTGWTITATLSGKTNGSINANTGILEYNSANPSAVFYELTYISSGTTYISSFACDWNAYTSAGAFSGRKSTTNSYTSAGNYLLSLANPTSNANANVSLTFSANSFTIPALFTGNLQLTANWEANKYTVTLDNQSATNAGTTSVTATYDSAMPAITVPTRTGYTFGGYFSETEGNGTQYYNANGTSARTWNIANDATLYAKWTPYTYTVIFNANEPTGASSSVSGSTANQGFTYGIAQNLRANGFTLTGWTFQNWNTVANGSGTAYTDGQSVINLTATNNGTVNLYAQWKANTYTISFDANGGTGGQSASVTATYDSAMPSISTTAPSRTGYTFTGWFDAATGGTQYYTAAGVSARNWNKTSNATLYAQWEANTYTVVFNANKPTGASGSVSGSTANQGFTYDVAQNLNANGFSLTGWTFQGWNTAANGSGTSYADKASVKNLTATNNGTVNLYAQWKANTYTVVFNANKPTGASGSVSGSTANQGFTYDVAQNLNANGFSLTGWTFQGWNTAANGSGASYSNQQSVNNLTATNGATVTLYAQWKANTYKVKFNANGGSGTMADQAFTYDVSQNLTANAFTRTGYHFTGWNTKSDGTGTSYTNQQSVNNLTATNGGTFNLYAQWEALVPYLNANWKDLIATNVAGASTGITKQKIASIEFATAMPTDESYSASNYCEVGAVAQNSTTVNESVRAYYYKDGDNLYHIAFVSANADQIDGYTIIKAPTNSSELFAMVNVSLIDQILDSIVNETEFTGEMSEDDMPNISSIQFNGLFDTTGVTNMSKMFYFNIYTSDLDVSGFNTASVTNMSGMFTYCASFNGAGVSNFNTASVTDTSRMFLMNQSITSLNLTNWNVANVTNMSAMFYDSDNLTSVEGLAGWNVSNVTNMKALFHNCYDLTSVGDLSNWDVSSVTNMSKMFYNCFRWDVTSSSEISYITIGDLSNWDVSSVTDMSWMFGVKYVEYRLGLPRYMSRLMLGNISEWDVSNVTNMSGMFSCATYILYELNTSTGNYEEIGDLSDWNVAKVTDMSYMFVANTQTDFGFLSSWNVSSVVNMKGMFKCAGMDNGFYSQVDISSWDVSNVTDMSEMFYHGGYLNGIQQYLSNWNVSNVTDMSGMFYGCSADIDFGSWNVGNVTNTYRMFYSFDGEIDLTNWDLSAAVNMSEMFREASSLPTLTGSKVSAVTNLLGIFYNCCNWSPSATNAKNLDLSGWDLSLVENTANMFYGCKALVEIKAPKSIKTGVTIDLPSGSGMSWFVATDTSAAVTQIANNTTPTTLGKTIKAGYVLTFDANGGTVSPTRMISYNGATITLPTPTWAYHAFNGWTPGGPAGATYTPTANTTLTANWSIYTYTVVFNSNKPSSASGSISGSTANQSFTYGVAQNLNANGFTLAGWTFQGWNTAANGSGTTYADKASVNNLTGTNNGTVNLYAQWKANTYTVTLDNQSATTAGTTSVTATYDSAMPAITLPTKTGYTFGGYYTGTNGGGTQYYTAAGASARTWNLTSNTTLYAKWIANTYKVVFNGNKPSGASSNVSGSTADQSFTYGTAQNLRANGFTLKGWTFQGWNTKSDGTGTSYTNQQSVNNLTTTNGATVNLYAKWTANTYTAKFFANGRTITTSNGWTVSNDGRYAYKSMTYDSAIGAFPTVAGYSYDGAILGCADLSDFITDTYALDTKSWRISLQNNLFAVGQTVYFNIMTVSGLSSLEINDRVIPSSNYTVSVIQEAEGVTLVSVVGSFTIPAGTSYIGELSFIDLNFTSADAISIFGGEQPFGFDENGLSLDYDPNGTATVLTSSSIVNYDYNFILTANELTANTYYVQFNGNKPSGASQNVSGTMSNQTFTYGSGQNLTANAFSLFGYDFAGWNTKADGSGTSYSNSAYVNNLTTTNGGTVQLYAQWAVKPGYLNYTWKAGLATNHKGESTGITQYVQKTMLKTITFASSMPSGYTADNYCLIGAATQYSSPTNPMDRTENVIAYYKGDSTNGFDIAIVNPAGGTIYAPATANYLFSDGNSNWQLTSLNSIDFGNVFSTVYCTTINYAFLNCSSLTALDLSGWDLSNVTSTTSFIGTSHATLTEIKAPKAIKSGTTIALPAYTSGTSASNSIYWYVSGTTTIITSISNDVSVLGKTIRRAYRVYFNANSGTVSPESMGCAPGGTVTLPTPTRSGYSCSGWYTAASGGTKVANAGASYTATENITLYAQWVDTTAPTVSVSRTDYNTLRWSATDGAGVTHYAITNSSSTPVDWTSKSGTSVSGTKDISSANTWYVWVKDAAGNTNYDSIASYEVTRTQGAGATLTTKYESSSGSTFTTSPIYVLNGTKIYIAVSAATGYSSAVVKVNNSNFTSGNTHTVSGTTTIVSSATANTYTVSFDANGGSGGQTANVTATYDSAMPSISTTAPTKTGYTFGGWYDTSAATGGTQYYTAAGASARTWNKTANTTLYARWTPNTYTVSFDANGGSGGEGASVIATYDSAMPSISATAPTKTGYTFGGWYDTSAATGGTQYYTAAGASARNWDKTANTTLYARWTANTYTVQFHPNGGSGGQSANVTATYGSAMPSISTTKPTRTGCTFGGWYDTSAATGGTKYYNADGTSARTWDKDESVILYARWIDNVGPIVSVSMTDYNTFSWTASDNIGVTGYAITNSSTAPSSWTTTGTLTSGTKDISTANTWYVWAKDAAGHTASASIASYQVTRSQGANTTLTTKYTNSSGSAFTSTIYVLSGTNIYIAATASTGYTLSLTVKGSAFTSGNIHTVTAATAIASSATANTYTVSFNANGGSGGQSANVTATYASAMPSISTTAPTRTGYTFAGWYDATSGGTQYYTAAGASARTWNKTANTTLYARWTANTYTVSFNANGGSGGQSANVTATYGSAMPSISTTKPTKTGYTFGGWYDTSAATGGTKYYNADGTSARTWNKTANTTLYARWTANTYTVSFNANGGSGGQSANVTATYGSAMPSISTTKPTKTGYTFGGWYDTSAATGGTKYYNADGTSARTWNKTATTTLYARWTANTYTITFDKDGGTGGTSTLTVTYGSAVSSITAPTKTGYTFDGYTSSTESAFNEYFDENGAWIYSTTYNIASDITVYAFWIPNTYTVTFTINNSTNYSNVSIKINETTTSLTEGQSYTFTLYDGDEITVSATCSGTKTSLAADGSSVTIQYGFQIAGQSVVNFKKSTATRTISWTYDGTSTSYTMEGYSNSLAGLPPLL